MTIDAAEIAAWREAAQRCKDADGPIDDFDSYDLLDLLDELEKAWERIEAMRQANAGMAAERDAALAQLRELLIEARPFVQIARDNARARSCEDWGQEERRVQAILDRIDAAL